MTPPLPLRAHLANLVGLDTSNDGSPVPHTAPNVRLIIDYINDIFGGRGEVILTGPDRSLANLVVRIPGSNPELAPVLVHSHVDVVPATGDWDTDPFVLTERDGWLHGRGVTDMKHMIAYILAAVQRWEAEGIRPQSDLIFAFFADEECGGFKGAFQVVEERPDLFQGIRLSLGEGGGYSDERGNMLVSVAERGVGALTLRAKGSGGHASMPMNAGDNPLLTLSSLATRLATLPHGISSGISYERMNRMVEVFGHGSPMTRLGITGYFHSVTPTVLRAGNLPNVIPDEASLRLDVRMAPGRDQEITYLINGIIGDEGGIESEFLTMESVGNPEHTEVPPAIEKALASANHRALPYVFPASTDAKHLRDVTPLNIGFIPTPGFNPYDQMHSVNEAIPVESLLRGGAILDEVLLNL